ncbi:MAG: DUF1080 domain-containing protein [Bacteroidales bacterium]|nr:DUF1080 domain-containing protein [Bacteroidales bacterium]
MKRIQALTGVLLTVIFLSFFTQKSLAQDKKIVFGKEVSYGKYISDTGAKDVPVNWINVNTAPDTWHTEKDILICSGQPIGVMRSEKMYENFILHVEWKHLEAGGNSGVFVWSNANPPEDTRLPDGVEVQMLELDWVNQNARDGVKPPVAYVHGELFGVGGVTTVPDNPRGTRSKSIENRCKGKGEWNTYDVVCIDGVIRLSVNGKFVNGITKASQRKGYLCLESEGAPIHFRNIRIIELAPSSKPFLSLHPQNPHYFMFRGKPAILIGSTEHYGAVMNLDFDYVTYFKELEASGLNVTRTFSGVYVEPAGAFGIKKNTMAPGPNRFICPWARSNEPGYANGGNKFDLSRWDENYFKRLKDFLTEAGKRNIVVELDLFSNIYDTIQWKLSPLYFKNNTNGTGKISDWKEVLSLRHPELLAVQERMVRKIVSELRDFDNLYYEVCNEPYFGDTLALREWEDYMTSIVADAEKDFDQKHLISNNVANHHRLVSKPREGVSIYNFHYVRPPKTVAANYHLNSVIGDNETGFDGIKDATYRREAWDFIMAGGAIFNHLDYSFTTDNEDGSFLVEKGQPGGGSKALRSQLKILAEFMKSIDYINMKPVDESQLRLTGEGNKTIRALGKDGFIAAYVCRKDTASGPIGIEINLRSGSYKITLAETTAPSENVAHIRNHPGGWLKIASDGYFEDLAIKIEREK